jgi:hypothetical protein
MILLGPSATHVEVFVCHDDCNFKNVVGNGVESVISRSTHTMRNVFSLLSITDTLPHGYGDGAGRLRNSTVHFDTHLIESNTSRHRDIERLFSPVHGYINDHISKVE